MGEFQQIRRLGVRVGNKREKYSGCSRFLMGGRMEARDARIGKLLS